MVNIRLKWVIIPFCRCSKILGEAGKQEILQQMFRKFCLKSSSEQIFSRKLPLGAPDTLLLLFHFDELQAQGYISIYKTLKNKNIIVMLNYFSAL